MSKDKVVKVKASESEGVFAQLEPELERAVSSKVEHAVLVRWVSVVDVMDPSTGERELITVCSDDMQAWEFEGITSNAPNPFEQ